MKAIEIQDGGKLAITERPKPTPGPGEVLIRIHGAGVNRPDLLQAAGHYPPPAGASDILGLECAGEITELGEGAGDWKLGDQVCALLTGGGYAEYATAPQGQCLAIPPGLSMIEAASLPETYFTVWSNLFGRAKLQAGETLLIHGGTSGIGVAAIQIATAMGVRVMATAGTDEKCQACLDLGAALAVNYKKDDFVAKALTFGDGAGVNVILDMVGGTYVARNIKALAPDGRLVNIAFLGGSKAEIDFMPVMLKRLTLTGSTLRARDTQFKANVAQELKEHVWPRLESAEIRPIVHATLPLSQADAAHKMMETGAHIGKIVLEVG